MQNTANRPRMDRTLSACFSHAFGKHSSCSRSIRGVRKAYGSQHLQMFIKYAPTTRFEYFSITHGRHIRMVDENNFERAQQVFGATECRSVCIRTELNSQHAPRTLRMLPEYDPFTPRTPKYLFEKQTEWHSG